MQFNIEEFAAMNNLNSLLMNHHQNSSHHEIQNHNHFDLASSHDEFLEQMLSSASFPWAADDDHSPTLLCDQSTASKMTQHQIGAKALMLQQQLLSMPQSDVVHNSSFQENDESTKALFNGFTELLGQNQNQDQSQYFHHNQSENFGTAAVASVSQAAVSGSGGGGAAGQPRQKVRARRGQATDPHSIAERLRRERIAERMKSLQEMVPNANKTDKASMLDEIIDYVKFLQLQVKVLSMSRLGGAAAVPPLLADPSSQSQGKNRNGAERASSSEKEEGMRAAEQQVAKLMSDDMGAAMQYLQGKGLCLMPISLATTIPRPNKLLFNAVLTAQSPTIGGVGELATSISKP